MSNYNREQLLVLAELAAEDLQEMEHRAATTIAVTCARRLARKRIGGRLLT